MQEAYVKCRVSHMEFPFISPSVTKGVQCVLMRTHTHTHTHTHTLRCVHISV